MLSGLRVRQIATLAGMPGLVHGFGQRAAAAPQAREAGRERLSRALSAHGRVLLMRQVHGARVWHAPWEAAPDADAAIAESAGLILAIETADCLPVLLVDPVRHAVGVAHAGWRGTSAGVVRATLGALVACGSRPSDLMAALGPCIGPCCYEVGPELRAEFEGDADPFFREGPRGRPHLDLRAANHAQLVEGGLPAERIHAVEECTACRADLYFSYRRDGPRTGRMFSFAGWSGKLPA